jgi:hypothetical protein
MKKITLGSFVIAGILILATSFVSVVGTQPHSTSVLKSPLFAHRTQQSNHAAVQRLSANYIGKGAPHILSFSVRSSLDELIEGAIQLINHNPSILDNLVVRMQKIPATAQVLAKYGLSQGDLEKYVAQIKNDPSLMRQQLDQAKKEIQTGGSHPLSLNTSNPFACVITIIALLPVIAVLLVVVLIVATITIVTCLNINNCLTKLTDQLQNIITQHLLPP